MKSILCAFKSPGSRLYNTFNKRLGNLTRNFPKKVVYYATLNQLSEAAIIGCMDLIRCALETSGPGLSNAHRMVIVSILLAPLIRYKP